MHSIKTLEVEDKMTKDNKILEVIIENTNKM